jgi:rare lipoprotein A
MAPGLGAVLLLASCAHHKPAPPPPPVQYVLEPAWQAGDIWFYPHETFDLDQTGIATVIEDGHDKLTTDNETYDPDAMAAAMQSVQLPAIATVTNLENGHQVTLRINDRGPENPARLIAVTPRVALLLGMSGPARVRVQFDPRLSGALAHQLQGHSADIAIQAAPMGAVAQSDLAPLSGSSQEAVRSETQTPQAAAEVEAPSIAVPLRLPDQWSQAYADPGTLMIDAGTFTHESAARRRLASLPDATARIVRSRSGGQTSYAVEAGPYQDIAEADGALARIIEDGATDARIVVDLQ